MAAIRVFVYDRSQFPVAFLYCSFIKRQWIPLNSCLDFSPPPRRCFPSHVYVYSHKPSFDLPTTLTLLFFSSPCCRRWISLYTTRNPALFSWFFQTFPLFFFYWIRSWIIQKKGYTILHRVCVYIALKAGCLSYIGWMCVYTGGRVKRPVGAWRVYKSRVYTHRSCIWLPYFGPQGFL